jgi:hypothetical protein
LLSNSEGQNKLRSSQFGLLNRNVLERHLLGPRETYVANPISVKSCVSALKNKPAPCVKTWVPSPQNVSCSWERNLSEGKQGVSRLEHVRKWSLLPLRTFVIEKKCGLSVFLPPGIPGLPGSKQTLDEKINVFPWWRWVDFTHESWSLGVVRVNKWSSKIGDIYCHMMIIYIWSSIYLHIL